MFILVESVPLVIPPSNNSRRKKGKKIVNATIIRGNTAHSVVYDPILAHRNLSVESTLWIMNLYNQHILPYSELGRIHSVSERLNFF